jgi:hypothetical protein
MSRPAALLPALGFAALGFAALGCGGSSGAPATGGGAGTGGQTTGGLHGCSSFQASCVAPMGRSCEEFAGFDAKSLANDMASCNHVPGSVWSTSTPATRRRRSAGAKRP